MIKFGLESFGYTMMKLGQIVLKGVNWVHNDKIRSNILERVSRIHYGKIWLNGLERSQLATQ